MSELAISIAVNLGVLVLALLYRKRADDGSRGTAEELRAAESARRNSDTTPSMDPRSSPETAFPQVSV